MSRRALFTASDLAVVDRAATLAEGLTGEYFGLARNEWRVNPYRLFTWKEVDQALYRHDVFAQVIRYERRAPNGPANDSRHKYGILLQDPNILRALLRPLEHDLWTLSLFVLTHELIHIVRFRMFGVDVQAPEYERDQEENLVLEITRDILSGVANTDEMLKLYVTKEV
jgi:hypothetical protein